MPVLLSVDVMRREATSDRTRRALDRIETCVHRGTDLVKQVLVFARGTEGPRAPIDIGAVIAEVRAIAGSTFPKNVTLTTTVAADLPQVTGDPTQLTQVFLNLCLNARDAIPGGGRITISEGRRDVSAAEAAVHGNAGAHCVVVEVADDGTGMAQTVIDHAFEPFFTTKDPGKGTGLGLSTSLGIVKSQGGFITASSEVGRGSTFRVFLPLPSERVDAPAPVVPEADLDHPRAGELILFVDDETVILDIVRDTLESSGYEVLTATNGSKGLDAYRRSRERKPLVITGIMMPSMDGAALIGSCGRSIPRFASSR